MEAFMVDRGMKTQIHLSFLKFNGGEEHVKVHCDAIVHNTVQITSRINDSRDVMKTLVTVDAIKRYAPNELRIQLTIPYFPYARQDRVCNVGESLSIKVMADLINTMNLDKVIICDPHSDVTPSLINNCEILDQHYVFQRSMELYNLKGYTLISPDAGALKKVELIAKKDKGEHRVVQASKIRNLNTGQITHTELHGNVKGDDCLIIDDICDGGRTFIELAKILKMNGAGKIHLYVTHGIFSNGLDVLDEFIDAIYTTDSIRPRHLFQKSASDILHIIDIFGE